MKNKKILLRSKWVKWKFLNNLGDLKSYQPITCPYSPLEALEFLNSFESVFVKPDNSLGGNNVIKLSREGTIISAVHESQNYRFLSIHEFDKWLEKIRGGACFLVQQGIDLVSLDGNPVDIRTIVQLNEHNCWELTGMFAKVAKKNSIVTNVHAGGKMIPVSSYLIDAGFSELELNELINEISKLSIKICEAFSKKYRNVIYGLDIGLDKSGKLWLIEINTKPRLDVLKRIDKQMYLRASYIASVNRQRKKTNN